MFLAPVPDTARRVPVTRRGSGGRTGAAGEERRARGRGRRDSTKSLPWPTANSATPDCAPRDRTRAVDWAESTRSSPELGFRFPETRGFGTSACGEAAEPAERATQARAGLRSKSKAGALCHVLQDLILNLQRFADKRGCAYRAAVQPEVGRGRSIRDRFAPSDPSRGEWRTSSPPAVQPMDGTETTRTGFSNFINSR